MLDLTPKWFSRLIVPRQNSHDQRSHQEEGRLERAGQCQRQCSAHQIALAQHRACLPLFTRVMPETTAHRVLDRRGYAGAPSRRH